jgi:hypothetical protein
MGKNERANAQRSTPNVKMPNDTEGSCPRAENLTRGVPATADLEKRRKTRAIERADIWSPDECKIVFHSDGDGPSQIHVMNADGSNPVCLTRTRQ